MTLIYNEIRLVKGFESTMVVAASDRRITNQDGCYNSTRRKLFRVPYLGGAISYFGLAEVMPGGTRKPLAEWLPAFIARQADASGFEDFCERLREELNQVVPSAVLGGTGSGFHICGYDSAGLPDFWFLTNIGGMDGPHYTEFRGSYGDPASHFLGRDARRHFDWDGSNRLAVRSGIQAYRNGDLRVAVILWELLDKVFEHLQQYNDFHPPTTAQQYAEYVKFKFEVIAYIYKKRAEKEIIGRPIDVMVFPGWGQSPVVA